MSEQATNALRIFCSKDLPNQLEIRKGIIVMIKTGEPATFDFPDGTQVNVVPHDDLVKCVDEQTLYRSWGA